MGSLSKLGSHWGNLLGDYQGSFSNASKANATGVFGSISGRWFSGGGDWPDLVPPSSSRPWPLLFGTNGFAVILRAEPALFQLLCSQASTLLSFSLPPPSPGRIGRSAAHLCRVAAATIPPNPSTHAVVSSTKDPSTMSV
ncbi:hypothetical protein M0R45_022573 [Rubus argutus]|uniref:Uncharacterized protein n=1 Tax=Rubus argutus TaxID=59490 RepID=A0AAW1XGH6_RUBAR